jgi:FixJ family two-component response regulator
LSPVSLNAIVSGVKDMGRKHQWVAVVDDDESVRGAVHGALKSVGFRALAFASAEEFLNSDLRTETACLISDIQMPGMSGLELQATLAKEEPRIPIIFITAFGDKRVRAQALKAGALEFLDKPFDDDLLLEIVRRALKP